MATQIIGLTKSKTFDLGSGQQLTLTFWAIEEMRTRVSAKDGEVMLVPFPDKTTFLSDPKSFFLPGRIRFRLNVNNWPVVTGQDSYHNFYSWLKLQFEIENSDGDTINGGIDWTLATPETIEV